MTVEFSLHKTCCNHKTELTHIHIGKDSLKSKTKFEDFKVQEFHFILSVFTAQEL